MLNYNCEIMHILAKQLSHVIIGIMIVANRAVIADKGLVLLKMLDSPKTQAIYVSEMPQNFTVSQVVLALWVNISKTSARYRKHNLLPSLEQRMVKAILHYAIDIIIKSVYR